MNTDPIVRVFRAQTKPGKGPAFQEFFLNEALPMIRRQAGLVSVEVGLPLEESGSEFLMVTRWRDLESLKRFAGENWDRAVIHPKERQLLADVYVYHYRDGIGE